ncbi:MAG: hypothetical protein QW680_10945 [Pyrobaculum sp.]
MSINIYDDIIIDLFNTFPECIARNLNGDRKLLSYYNSLISQKYIPTIFLDSLSTTFKTCSNKIINWFNAFTQYYKINTTYEIPEPYRARTAFVVAFMVVKHMLEYQLHAAPKDVQEIASQRPVIKWYGVGLTLDDIVGFLWPITLNVSVHGRIEQGIETIRILTFRENIKNLKEVFEASRKKTPGAIYKIFKILPSTLAFFNLISESYSLRVFKALGEEVRIYRYKFVSTGFGNYLLRLLKTHVLSSDKLPVNTIAEIIKNLDATAYAHVYLIDNLMESIRANWLAVAREAQRRFAEKASKDLEPYSAMDAELDTMAYFYIVTDSFLYLQEEGGDESLRIRQELSKYIWPNYIKELPKTWEIFVKKFLADAVRI